MSEDGLSLSWLLTKEALEHAQEAAYEKAAQVLRERCGRGPTAIRPLGIAAGSQLVTFYARKVPELCRLCSAPTDVAWTALVFFQRFYAFASPMEFDPCVMMYTSVHLACKIEELREITLDKLLEESGFSDDVAMKVKITDLELELLETIGFKLLVEPKPADALRLLAEEGARSVLNLSSIASPEAAEELLARAESIVFGLCTQSNALLIYPASLIFAAAWAAALDESSKGEQGTQTGKSPSAAVLAMLSNLKKKVGTTEISRIWKDLQHAIDSSIHRVEPANAAMQETAKTARHCQRAFGILHEERKQRSEAHRKERKRRRHDGLMPGARSESLEELRRKAKVLQGCQDERESQEDFVIHGPRDMELTDE
ncbi:unnamed protein product [Durusdinium trenchii]|uniref:Cyclin CCL1 n=2 Tax=Durusdinium trenchii TaxID=1381693 RepID=A0ABP0LSB3_9DINO